MNKKTKQSATVKLEKNTISNEQLILEAAETEFLEKGYVNARTTAIAKRAGVTHAMLHYYYRTKESLFQKIFYEKINLLSTSISQRMNKQLPFEQMIEKFVELHFDFVQQNPRLIGFIMSEVLANEEYRRIVIDMLKPKFLGVFNQLDKLLSVEIAKRRIKPVKVADLILNVASINITTFMLYPVLKDTFPNSKKLETFIRQRKANNVQFVLNALKV